MRVEELACLEANEVGGLDVHVRARDRELHALILADRSAEHHAPLRIRHDTDDEPVTIADALRGYQRALVVETVEDVLEALAFLADQVLGGDLLIVEEELIGL